MIPVYQTKFSSADGSTHGNCLAACVASIFEIPIDQVPAWEEMGEEWSDSFLQFIEESGYEYEGSYVVNGGTWGDMLQWSAGVDGYFIVGGKSPRSYVQRGHAVIYRNGEMVHDPHPSGDGLSLVEDVYLIEKMQN